MDVMLKRVAFSETSFENVNSKNIFLSAGARKTNKTDNPAQGDAGEPLHKTLGFVLVFAQCFGLLPVLGVRGASVKNLKFTWWSWRMLYTILSMIGSGFAVLMSLMMIFRFGIEFNKIINLAFYGSTFFTTILFLQLASIWPKFMSDWNAVELSMLPCYGYPKRLTYYFKKMTFVMMGLAFAEHVLAIIKGILNARECGGTDEMYFRLEFPETFLFIPYSLPLGIFVRIINSLSAFTWTFTDLFIILMSTALAVRFTQVTEKIKTASSLVVIEESFWKTTREDYNRLSKLCRKLDRAISYIILMSFGNNLYFILVQLFQSLKSMRNWAEKTYFFFSFGLLLTRTVAVSLYAASVNDESKGPLEHLNSVPSHVYCVEIQRFIQQITYDTVTLTGRKLFNVTRGLVFSIAGTIVTYELVLIQFNGHILKDATNSTERSLCP